MDVQQASGRWFRGPVTWRSVVRIIIVGLWVVWAALSWWVAPRESSVAQVRADLAADHIEAYQWGDHWSDTSGTLSAGQTLERSNTTTVSILAWRTPDLRVHYVNLDPSDMAGRPSSVSTVDADDTTLGRALAAGAPSARTNSLDPTASPIGLILLLVSLAVLLILVSHPAPVIGTRWFWFWTMTSVPYGLGLLYWLARERPWSTSAPEPLTLTDRDPRRRWYHGIIVGILSSIALAGLLAVLKWLLGGAIFPV